MATGNALELFQSLCEFAGFMSCRWGPFLWPPSQDLTGGSEGRMPGFAIIKECKEV